jgi:hypothetical protein
LQESGKVPSAVPIAVLKRNDCNFVDDGAAPPRFLGTGRGFD